VLDYERKQEAPTAISICHQTESYGLQHDCNISHSTAKHPDIGCRVDPSNSASTFALWVRSNLVHTCRVSQSSCQSSVLVIKQNPKFTMLSQVYLSCLMVRKAPFYGLLAQMPLGRSSHDVLYEGSYECIHQSSVTESPWRSATL
jgi:hypothetical protein